MKKKKKKLRTNNEGREVPMCNIRSKRVYHSLVFYVKKAMYMGNTFF